MEYFYTPPSLVTPPTLSIEDDELNHLAHVMRLRAGDTIRVVDGMGNAYDAVITLIARHVAQCSITAHHVMLHEPLREVTLAVGILKNPSRYDVLVEKSVELGVRTIVPLLTERTIPRQAKVDRWRKLCLAAMKQSRRSVLPDIRPLMAFDEFISSVPPDSVKLIAHEKETGIVPPFRPGERDGIALCVGPEGGFSNEEIQRAAGAGFATLYLGPRRLRTETAAIAAVASILRVDEGTAGHV